MQICETFWKQNTFVSIVHTFLMMKVIKHVGKVLLGDRGEEDEASTRQLCGNPILPVFVQQPVEWGTSKLNQENLVIILKYITNLLSQFTN